MNASINIPLRSKFSKEARCMTGSKQLLLRKIVKNQYIITILIGLALLSSCNDKQKDVRPVRKNFTETVFASGVLVPDNLYNITAQSEGYLVKLNFNEGDTVQTGSIMAVIDNKQNDYNALSADALLSIASVNVSPNAPALKQAEANLGLAKEKVKQDEVLAERYKKLYENNSISKLELENTVLSLESSKASLKSMQENYNLVKQQADQQLIIQKTQTGISSFLQGMNEVKAVVGGKVYKKYKQLGEYVRRGDIIAELGNTSSFYAKLSVDETSISKIKVSQQVVLQLNTNKEKKYNSIVTEIYPAFDEQSQSFYCKARFTDDLDFTISGTQLQANIIIGNKENVLAIPGDCLGYGNKVRVKGKGIVSVTTGFVSGDWVEILNGVDENSIIIRDKK
jgi:multidrug efflux pump subunit AcrA (membrane-fusion protein)